MSRNLEANTVYEIRVLFKQFDQALMNVYYTYCSDSGGTPGSPIGSMAEMAFTLLNNHILELLPYQHVSCIPIMAHVLQITTIAKIDIHGDPLKRPTFQYSFQEVVNDSSGAVGGIATDALPNYVSGNMQLFGTSILGDAIKAYGRKSIGGLVEADTGDAGSGDGNLLLPAKRALLSLWGEKLLQPFEMQGGGWFRCGTVNKVFIGDFADAFERMCGYETYRVQQYVGSQVSRKKANTAF